MLHEVSCTKTQVETQWKVPSGSFQPLNPDWTPASPTQADNKQKPTPPIQCSWPVNDPSQCTRFWNVAASQLPYTIAHRENNRSRLAHTVQTILAPLTHPNQHNKDQSYKRTHHPVKDPNADATTAKQTPPEEKFMNKASQRSYAKPAANSIRHTNQALKWKTLSKRQRTQPWSTLNLDKSNNLGVNYLSSCNTSPLV